MAVTIASGQASTATPTANQLKIDMREEITMLDQDNSQFTTMLMKLPSEKARSFKVEWLEDQYMPRLATLAAAVTATTDNGISVGTGEGYYFNVGDTVINATTLEVLQVTAGGASAAVSVSRSFGSVAAATSPSGAQIVIIGVANAQGASSPEKLITKTAAAYNYTQIQRHAWEFTNTAEATEYYGGQLYERERMKKAIEHKAGIENTLFFGGRSYSATGPLHSCGGLLEFISTLTTHAGGVFDVTDVQDFLRGWMQHGSNNKVLFAAPLPSQVFSAYLQDNWVRTGRDERIWGVKVDAIVSSVYGTEIPVIVKRDWGNYSSAANQFGGMVVGVDMDNVQYAPLRPTVYVPNTQANDRDSLQGEFRTEHSLKVEIENTHALLNGITG